MWARPDETELSATGKLIPPHLFMAALRVKVARANDNDWAGFYELAFFRLDCSLRFFFP